MSRSRFGAGVKSGSIYIGVNFIQQLGKFLVVPIFWQKLTPADYGVLAVNDMIGLFLGMILGLQLDTAVTRHYYEWPEAQRKHQLGIIWLASWTSSIVIGAIVMGAIYPLAPLLFPDVPFFPYLFLGLLSTILRSLATLVPTTLRIKQMPFGFAGYILATFAVQLSLNIFFVLQLDMGLYGLLFSYVIGDVVTAVVCLAIMSRFAVPAIALKPLRSYLAFSLPYAPSQAIHALSQIIDRFLLQRFASLELLGIYSIASRFAGLTSQVYVAIKMAYVPYMMKTISLDARGGRETIARASLVYFTPIVVFALAVGLFTKDFVLYIGKTQYYPVIDYVPLLLIPSLIGSLNVLFAPGLFLAKRSGLMWLPSTAGLVVATVCGLLLVPAFGLNGIVATRYCVASTIAGTMIYFSQKYYFIPTKWHRVGAMLAIMVFALVVSSQITFPGLALNIGVRTLVFLAAVLVLIVAAMGFSRVSLVMRGLEWR